MKSTLFSSARWLALAPLLMPVAGNPSTNRSLTPPPGSVPAVAENVTYTSLKDDFQHAPKFPDIQDTPWTHGGPPPEYVPTDEDAREDWS